MKKTILATVMLVAFTASTKANDIVKDIAADCTVTYTNSKGIKFTATASTCGEAYEMIAPHVEASSQASVEYVRDGEFNDDGTLDGGAILDFINSQN